MAALLVSDYDRTTEPLGKLTLSKSYDFKGKRIKGTKSGRAREVPVYATPKSSARACSAAGSD